MFSSCLLAKANKLGLDKTFNFVYLYEDERVIEEKIAIENIARVSMPDSGIFNCDRKMASADEPGIIVVKKSSPVFEIMLDSNPTTGYSWQLKKYSSDLLIFIGQQYFASPTISVGSGGRERWTFEVKPEGFENSQFAEIHLVYLRPWNEQEAQSLTFKVVILSEN